MKIPKLFLEDSNLCIQFIRGFVDAEFSLVLKRRYKRLKYYPVIECNISSKKIHKQLIEIFEKMGLKPIGYRILEFDKRFGKYWEKYRIDLNGVENTIKFLSLFRPLNPRFYSGLKRLSKVLEKQPIRRKSYEKLVKFIKRWGSNSGARNFRCLGTF